MNCTEIQEILITDYISAHPYLCTNFDNAGYFESDLFAIDRKGKLKEFEIKTSRADYFADFKKKVKHELYSGGKTVNWRNLPNQFYYVCEENLIKTEEIPKYAGLIYIKSKTPLKGYYSQVIKRAPVLHKNVVEDWVYKRLAQTLSARLHYGCAYSKYKHGKQK